jgi:hypothetical protein
MRSHDVDESQEALLHELFTNRFISLKRRYNEWQIKEGEDAVQRADRVKEKRRKGRKMQRKDTRRNNVSELLSTSSKKNSHLGFSFMQIAK